MSGCLIFKVRYKHLKLLHFSSQTLWLKKCDRLMRSVLFGDSKAGSVWNRKHTPGAQQVSVRGKGWTGVRTGALSWEMRWKMGGGRPRLLLGTLFWLVGVSHPLHPGSLNTAATYEFNMMLKQADLLTPPVLAHPDLDWQNRTLSALLSNPICCQLHPEPLWSSSTAFKSNHLSLNLVVSLSGLFSRTRQICSSLCRTLSCV